MNRYYWFLLIFIVVASCKNSLSPDEATISGVIEGAAGHSIFLEELTVENLARLDSAEVDKHSSFKFSYLPDEAGIYLLKNESGGFITFIMNKGDRIEIQSDTSLFSQEYEISGNRDSEILQSYFVETAINQERLDSLSKVFNNSTHQPNFYKIKLGLDSAFAELFANQQRFARQSILENPQSLASVLIINQRFGSNKLFNEEGDFDLMLEIDSCLMKAYPGNSHVIAHHNRVENILEKQKQQKESEARLAPGKFVPELNLPNPNKEIISLSSLKGKVVILYFWSSYSPPCRAANIQLKEIYGEYKENGLEIYAVSFDHNRKIWSDVVAMENLSWINVSDLQGERSMVKKLFNLTDELPYFYLIDRDGKIVAKSESVNKIEQILDREVQIIK